MKRPTGMSAFVVVWAGQLISMLGSGLTTFATLYWVYQLTSDATSVSLMALSRFAPSVLFGPIAGALVDRWNRKLVMAISDLAAILTTIALMVLAGTGHLQPWHLYVLGLASSFFGTFQWPAYTAAMSTMVPKEHYSRAHGMISFAQSGVLIIAPALAGVLYPIIGVTGILVVDVVTFFIAITLLFAVEIPSPPRSPDADRQGRSLWREAADGFRYVLTRPGLLGLQVVFLFMNFFTNLAQPARQTMVLMRTGSDMTVLAGVSSAMAFGSLAGSLLMTVWGGFQRKVYGVLLGILLYGLLGSVLFGLGRSATVWMVAGFLMQVFMVVLGTSSNTIWQRKVPLQMQGRVMATRRMIAHGAIPLGMAVSGPLADKVMEPAMRPGGALAPIFGGLVGTDPGAGLALMVTLAGILGGLVGLVGFFSRAIREVETDLSDHEGIAVPAPAGEAKPSTTGA